MQRFGMAEKQVAAHRQQFGIPLEQALLGRLIYFDQPTKSDVLDRLARVVAPDGFLILGAAETTIGLTQAFKSVPDRRGLYAPGDPAADRVVRLPVASLAS